MRTDHSAARLLAVLLLMLLLAVPVAGARGATAGPAPQTVVEIFADADSTLLSNLPDDNTGSSTGLLLGYNTSAGLGAERILVHFDLDGVLPPDATIHSAFLMLYLESADPPSDAPMGTVLRRLASPWDELTVTWSTEPAWGGIRSTAEIGSGPGEYVWNVTGLVTDWLRGTHPNYGVEIIGDEHVQQRERLFFSRESASGLEPRLIVDFSTPPADIEPPEVTVNALPDFSPRTFTVRWEGSDPGGSGIAYYDVRYRIDGGAWGLWLSESPLTSAAFTGEHGRSYEFEARGVDRAGNVEPFLAAEATTVVDDSIPSATINPLPTLINARTFTVSWRGSDGSGGSGIACYDIGVRQNEGQWVVWLPCTTATSALYTAPADAVYDFEARARDNAGQTEAFTGFPEASIIVDTEAPFVVPRAYLPLFAVD